MAKLLVFCEDYPDEGHPYKMAWAHTRNVFYAQSGLGVTVCSFSASTPYSFQGIAVIPAAALEEGFESAFDIFLSHSPNIRNHIPFLVKLKRKPMVLFCHGTESLYVNHDYCAPYPFMQEPLLKRLIRDGYDYLKMIILRWFIQSRRDRLVLVFVSSWMREKFSKNVAAPELLGVKSRVINNALWSDFYTSNYADMMSPKFEADFVTLRRLDYSKYCIDLVVKFALANPQYSFDIVGEGEYFEHYPKPKNVRVLKHHVAQADLAAFLSNYRCALMPTRVDAQGVMVCEMATYGMPVITSDIPVNDEMFRDFPNVLRMSEEEFGLPLAWDKVPLPEVDGCVKKRFSVESTLAKEVELLQEMVGTST